MRTVGGRGTATTAGEHGGPWTLHQLQHIVLPCRIRAGEEAVYVSRLLQATDLITRQPQ